MTLQRIFGWKTWCLFRLPLPLKWPRGQRYLHKRNVTSAHVYTIHCEGVFGTWFTTRIRRAMIFFKHSQVIWRLPCCFGTNSTWYKWFQQIAILIGLQRNSCVHGQAPLYIKCSDLHQIVSRILVIRKDKKLAFAFEAGDIVCWLVNPPIAKLDLFKSADCR